MARTKLSIIDFEYLQKPIWIDYLAKESNLTPLDNCFFDTQTTEHVSEKTKDWSITGLARQ